MIQIVSASEEAVVGIGVSDGIAVIINPVGALAINLTVVFF